jgi:hypothetical protein
LKEVLRFVRMAKIQAAMEIRGQNQIEINYWCQPVSLRV